MGGARRQSTTVWHDGKRAFTPVFAGYVRARYPSTRALGKMMGIARKEERAPPILRIAFVESFL
jgi:hypothetical protein